MALRALVLALTAVLLGAAQTPRALSLKPPEGAAERRIALVIGNGNYADAPLRNPVNDARSVAEALRACGFQVTELEDADRGAMFGAVRDFGTRIMQGGVGLFYYAGHGMQVKGRNYLIPVRADIRMEDEVPAQALEVDLVLAKMESARNRLNVLILDACRNNPFARSFRSGAAGLAQMDAPVGSYIAFATAPGKTAFDGAGTHGLYTQHLLANLRTPGLKVEDVFKRVRAGVLQETNGGQVPWDSSSMTGDFYFVPATPAAATITVADVPPVPVPVSPPSVAKPVQPAVTAPAGIPTPGQLLSDPLSGLLFSWVPAGSFTMGSPAAEKYRSRNEGPQHLVTFAKGFWLGRFEVMQLQYQAIMGINPSKFVAAGASAPVEQVSWDDAQAFVRKLNEKAGIKLYRLPSEAEWEYACRAGTTTPWSVQSTNGWFKGNSGKLVHPVPGISMWSGNMTHPVGQTAPNAWNLYDMSGNVLEWCEDVYHADYEGAPVDGSAWLDGDSGKRVVRGGDWDHYVQNMRSAYRAGERTGQRDSRLGFRVVRLPVR